ncbi:MAG: MBL fold metallo-hydrolase [Candidatus Bathyarchaeota archaeon]|nr:MAG: MBL fold metallo-hydrolase [Candidatus Bathyarchaeota archaeon]
MSAQKGCELIRDLFSRPLATGEVAFVYLGYAGIVLRLEDTVMAFDVANLLENSAIAAFERLDLLVFTHNHGDHYNRARARRILKDTAAHIVAQKQVAEDLGGAQLDRLTIAEHRSPFSVGGLEVVAINGVHPRPINVYRVKKGRLGVFHGGDSGYSSVKDFPAQLAFLPTGVPSPSCSPESAFRFTLDLNPRVAVAMHGTPAQMNSFKALVKRKLPDTTVLIPRKNVTETILL